MPPDTKKASYETSDDDIKHNRVGIWDLYFDLGTQRKRIRSSAVASTAELAETLPYLWRFTHEILSAGGDLLIVDLSLRALNAVLPAISLYYSGELLRLVRHSRWVIQYEFDTKFLIL